MGGKSRVVKQIMVRSKSNPIKSKSLFEHPISLRKSIGAVGAMAVFTALLAGCSSDSGEDGRIGDEFSSPLIEVEEALTTGDPQFLCSHLNSLDQIDCTNLVASSGGPESVVAESEAVENGELFAFTGDGFLLEILRTDIEMPDGIEYEWSVQSFETPTLSFPYGGEYFGKPIEPGTTLRLLPGELDVSQVSSNVDVDGLWTATPRKTDFGWEFVFAPAADQERRAVALISERCAAHLSSLTVESLLPENPPTPSFLQAGQEPGARGVSFVYQEGDSSMSRTMNYPKITEMADCEIREVTTSFPEVKAKIFVPEVLISGEVDYQTERTRFGVMRYGFLPRTVRAPFEIAVGITFGETETGASNEIRFAEPSLLRSWIINEPVPDNEIVGGRNSG